MPRADRKAPAPPVTPPAELLGLIQRFLDDARRPALIEPGEPLLLLERDRYTLEEQPAHVAIQAWDDRRNLVRRIRGIDRVQAGKLSLTVQRFAGKIGEMHLVDLSHPRTHEWERRGTRLVFRERFRSMLEREFPGWHLAELSHEADLQHSLSPAYPRALITRGTQAIAAIGASPDCSDFPALLSFGLIWLDYARRRDAKRVIHTLTFWAPSPVAPFLGFYLPYLDPAQARFSLFLYSDLDLAQELDPKDFGNVATELELCRTPPSLPFSLEHGEAVALSNGSCSLRVAGLEFARYHDGRLRNGRADVPLEEARANAAAIHALRNPQAPRNTILFNQNPEAWLESVTRLHLQTIDASLRTTPLYGQVPAIAAQNRTVLDLLAVDHSGRLAVLELKASQDLHLPLQALDYWLRVKWHLDRREFSRFGYFPGIELRHDPPRLLLIAPSLEFHPTTETVLRFLVPEIEVLRIGLGAQWREAPQVMFRLQGARSAYD